jgi:hypothetical protein
MLMRVNCGGGPGLNWAAEPQREGERHLSESEKNTNFGNKSVLVLFCYFTAFYGISSDHTSEVLRFLLCVI